MSAPARESLEERIDLRGRSLRQHAVRGTLINSGFQVGMAGLGFLRRFMLAAFLTQAEFGIWGLMIATLMTLVWLKQLGVGDKYVQQSEPDQELAFQRAFSLELALSLLFFVFLCAVLPIYGLAYGQPEIVLPGIVLAASIPISAFETPTMIAYRRMQFVKQRVLIAVDAVTAFVVTLGLGIAGAGYWALVIGVIAGSVLGAVAATLSSPYKLRWRFDWATVRTYARFSLPLLGYRLSNLIVIQGVLLIGARAVGIAGVGAIALAASVSALADRVDGIVSGTIYPAVCAVSDRLSLLHETFLKSNRVALMWSMFFGIGLALFAADLVHGVLGSRWEPAIGLLTAFGVIEAIRQIGFNWQIFFRALNDTRPIFIAALVNLGVFFVAIVPLMFAYGLTGYALGMAASVVAQIVTRGYFLRRLFDGFRLTPYLLRAVAPTVPVVALILLLRQWVDGGRTPARVLAELALYTAATIALTWAMERRLVTEIVGYMRGEGGLRSKAQPAPQVPPTEPSRA